MSKTIWLVDRSRMAAHGDCRRLRYLAYHYGGKGLQRKVASLPLINGDFVHKALACLIVGENLEDVLEALKKDYADSVRSRTIHGEVDLDFLIGEQTCLLEGLVRAWDRIRKRVILNEFDVIDVEKEVEWEIAPGMKVMLRMDLVLRRKRDRLLFIKDYKTVGTLYDDWAKKFEHDTQLLCYTLAAEAIYGEPIGGLLMEGLVKGRRAKEKAITSPFHGQMIQQSPLCYAYKSISKTSGLPVFETTWNRGAEKVPVWEMQGGIEHWLATEFSDLDLQNLFVPLPAIKPLTRDQERWKRQTLALETSVQSDVAVAEALRQHWEEQQTDEAWDQFQEGLDTLFPQNFNQCFRFSFNHPCAMTNFCFTEAVEADPLGSGLYEPRVPHHLTEDEEAA